MTCILNSYLSIFGNIGQTIQNILIMLIVTVVLFLMLKFKEAGKFIFIGIIVLILFTGAFATYYDIQYLTSTGQTVGSVIDSYLNEKTDISLVSENKFEFTNIGFKATLNDYEYQSVVDIVPALNNIDSEKNDYAIYVNNNKCYYNENGLDYVDSIFEYSFKDINQNTLLTDKLHIKFCFYDNMTQIIFTTNGGSNAVKYWQSYIHKNGLIIEIKKSDDEINNKEINIFDSSKFSYVHTDDGRSFYMTYSGRLEEFKTLKLPTKWNYRAEFSDKYALKLVCSDGYIVYDESEIVCTFDVNDNVIEGTTYVVGIEDIAESKSKYDFVNVKTDDFTSLTLNGDYLTVYIPSNVTSLPDSCFSGLTIKNLVLSEGIETIGSCAFGASEIDTVKLPSTITSINGERVFQSSIIKTLYMDKNVKYFGDNLFWGVKDLTIEFNGTSSDWNSINKSSKFLEEKANFVVHCIKDDVTLICTSPTIEI